MKRAQVLAKRGSTALEKKGAKGHKHRRKGQGKRVAGRGEKWLGGGGCCLAEGLLGCVDEVYESILVHLLPE